VLILPYVEEAEVSQQAIDKFNSMPNPDAYGAAFDSLNAKIMPMYWCPSDWELPSLVEKFMTADRRPMSYAGILGSYYARTNQCPTTKTKPHYCVAGNVNDLFGPNNYDGLLIHDWQVSLNQCTDGTSKTLLIGERWYQLRAWMIGAYSTGTPDPQGRFAVPNGPQPSTAWFACKNLTDKWPVNHSPWVACYKSHLNYYPDRPGGDRPTLPDSIVNGQNLITVNDLPFGSFHSGGANFCNGDGSVRFLQDDIDTKLYLALGSRNGDDVLPGTY
jgi:hypothetical protein